jgi:hypothetical protein
MGSELLMIICIWFGSVSRFIFGLRLEDSLLKSEVWKCYYRIHACYRTFDSRESLSLLEEIQILLQMELYRGNSKV